MGGIILRGSTLQIVDKHEAITKPQPVEDMTTDFMEKITECLFKAIVILGIPYFVYILLQAF